MAGTLGTAGGLETAGAGAAATERRSIPTGTTRIPPSPADPWPLENPSTDPEAAEGGALVIDLGAGGSRGRLTRRQPRVSRIALASAAGVVVVAVVLLAILLPRNSGGRAGIEDGPAMAGSGPSTASTTALRLDERLLGGPAGPADTADAVVTGLAVGADGVQVAVGRHASAAGAAGPAGSTPAAWSSADGRTWRTAAFRQPDGSGGGGGGGTMSAVTYLDGPGFVAVGSSVIGGQDPATARPAVWTSHDGRHWAALGDAGGLTGGITDVVAHRGELLAVGRADGPTGAGAVWRSRDGTNWTKMDTSTLGGPTEQHVDQIVELADGTLLAAGSELAGSATVTRLRRSSDGARWTLDETTLPSGVVVGALTRLSDGRTLAVGSRATDAGPQPIVLVGDRRGEHWVSVSVSAGAAPSARMELFGIAVAGGETHVAGAIAGTGVAPGAAVWSLPLPLPLPVNPGS
ncbi:sialidase family protein [Frankia tisae]|uniref:sialidase family protein n=1 Tax=Frankia tisae TaxID=2950104 RepID=UPI0021C22282|nr:sialidase family protein [Frankia tisae]